jgi:hypothetical protein
VRRPARNWGCRDPEPSEQVASHLCHLHLAALGETIGGLGRGRPREDGRNIGHSLRPLHRELAHSLGHIVLECSGRPTVPGLLERGNRELTVRSVRVGSSPFRTLRVPRGSTWLRQWGCSFLEEMRDQTDGPRHDTEAAGDVGRDAERARKRPDRSCHVDRDVGAAGLAGLTSITQQSYQLGVGAGRLLLQMVVGAAPPREVMLSVGLEVCRSNSRW